MIALYLLIGMYLSLYPFKFVINKSKDFRYRESVWIAILCFYTIGHIILASVTLNLYIPELLAVGYDFATSVMIVLFLITLSISVIMTIMAKIMDDVEKKP